MEALQSLGKITLYILYNMNNMKAILKDAKNAIFYDLFWEVSEWRKMFNFASGCVYRDQ